MLNFITGTFAFMRDKIIYFIYLYIYIRDIERIYYIDRCIYKKKCIDSEILKILMSLKIS